MLQIVKEETKDSATFFGLEKKTLDRQNSISCIVFTRDATKSY